MDPRFTAAWQKMKARRLGSTFLVVATLAFGILIGTVITHGVKGKEPGPNSADATPLQMPAPQQLSNAFSQIAKQLEPTVVNINTESTIKAPKRRPRQPGQGQEDDPFQDFFDRFFGSPDQGQGPGGQGSPEGMRQRSLGSGVIVDSKGYIVTNAHVVERADRIRVKLMDDPQGAAGHDAKVIGVDRETDLAVIKIDAGRALPSAKLGNSDSMNVGDWVLAIGSPFGLEESVTAGIVSAKGRNIVPRQQFQSFIQTDAAINPGNSGGPLVNMAGEVIGINTAIFTQSSGYQGVGFAMPSSTVLTVYNQLISPEHRVTRGSIGIEFNAVPNPAVARIYGVNDGVTVANVRPGSPADQAGVKVGDTITAVDGRGVKSGDELVNYISSLKPGYKAKVNYVRNGKSDSTSVTIADRAKLFSDRSGEEDEEADNSQPQDSRFGISVRNVTPDIASRLDIPANRGVIVAEVKPSSFGEDVGLSRGDVVLEINRQPVNSDDDFRRIQGTLKSGQDVVFLVRQGRGRSAGTIFLAGTLP
ncbi:MAG: Do family serine endopeptidase [Acidobacteriota bacterium]|nr:Do family serine endopeptidase [Acidobacteriota bacterium]